MRNLQQVEDAVAAMRAARKREERFTLVFLVASIGAAGVIAAVAIGILFAAWPVDAPLDASRYIEARR